MPKPRVINSGANPSSQTQFDPLHSNDLIMFYRFHPEKNSYTPSTTQRKSWFNHDSAPVTRKNSIYDDDMGGTDANEWLSNIHSALPSRVTSLANISIAQVSFFIVPR